MTPASQQLHDYLVHRTGCQTGPYDTAEDFVLDRGTQRAARLHGGERSAQWRHHHRQRHPARPGVSTANNTGQSIFATE